MFPLIELSGAPHERGRLHGQQARSRIERSIATYARLFAYCGIDWRNAQHLGAGYRDVIGGFDPAAIEEIEGIAAGCGRHVNEILTLNARTEILPPSYPGDPSPQWQGAAAANAAAGVPDWGECTAVAVQPEASLTGKTLLAQNWDWLGAQRPALVLLRIRERDGAQCLTLTEAGMLAKIGLNAHGFGVCLNIMRSRDDGARPGIPVHVLLRRLLRCTSVAEAIALARTLVFGGSSNILCADERGDAASLECSPAGLDVVRAEHGKLCHTNHFLAPEGRAGQAKLAPSLSSEPRLERALALSGERAKLGVADLERMLRDESDGLLSICRRPDPALPAEARIETVAAVVMELAERRMRVAPDVPSQTEFHGVGLDAAASALAA